MKISNSFSMTKMLSMALWISATLVCNSPMFDWRPGGLHPALWMSGAECRNMPNAGRSRGPNLGSAP
eukprot:6059348-Alexandrium_andersonii.AAC.1